MKIKENPKYSERIPYILKNIEKAKEDYENVLSEIINNTFSDIRSLLNRLYKYYIYDTIRTYYLYNSYVRDIDMYILKEIVKELTNIDIEKYKHCNTFEDILYNYPDDYPIDENIKQELINAFNKIIDLLNKIIDYLNGK